MPTEKLSKLTDIAKNIIPNKLSGLKHLSFSKKLINISKDNIMNTKKRIYLGLNVVYEKIDIPNLFPNRGIKK